MKLLTRYIIKSFVRNFILTLCSFAGIYLLVEFLGRVDDFVDNATPFRVYVRYFLNALPLLIVQVTPLSLLLAGFLTVGGFSRTGEITAMRAGGLSLYRISKPIIYTTFIITFFLILVQELVLPVSSGTLNQIIQSQTEPDAQTLKIRDKVWFRSGSNIVHIDRALVNEGALHNITMFELDENFQVTKRTDAASALYESGHWNFRNITRRFFSAENGEMLGSAYSKSETIPFHRKPDDFKRTDPKEWELNFSDLRKLAKKMRAEGYDETRILVDMHAHISSPFTCIVMALLGIPFALSRGRNTSLSFGIVISILVGVAYIMLHSVAMAFGYSGVLPPILATWSANILVGLTGLWLVLFRSQ